MFTNLRKFFTKIKTRHDMAKKGLIGARKRLAHRETLGAKAEKSRPVAIFIVCIVWLTATLTLTFPPAKHSFFTLIENQISPYTVYADFNFSYQDVIATEKKKQNIISGLPIIYKIDKKLTADNIKRVNKLFRTIDKIDEALLYKAIEQKKADRQKEAGALKNGDKGEEYKNTKDKSENTTPKKEGDSSSSGIAKKQSAFLKDKNLSDKTGEPDIEKILKSLPPEYILSLKMIREASVVKTEYIGELKKYLYMGLICKEIKASHKFGQKIRIEDVHGRLRDPVELADIKTPEIAAQSIAYKIARLYSPVDRKKFRDAVTIATKKILHGNLVYDKFLTEKIKNETIKNIRPVVVHIRKGDIIIAKGEKIGKSDVIRFNAYLEKAKHIEREKHFFRKVFQKIFICLILVVITGLYIYHIHPEIIKSNQKMGLSGAVIIISMLAVYGSIRLFDIISLNFNLSPNFIFLALPIALSAALLSVLLGMRAAFYTGVLISLHTALQLNLNNSFTVILGGTAVSCITAFAVRYSTNYKMYLFRTIFSVFFTTVLIYFSQYWASFVLLSSIVIGIELAFVNAVITGTAALLLLFILEPLFRISSDMSLLVLCDFNHPLLKKLQLEAPGSYHHSLMVATLAEQAATEINANPIKARACALFHDIGKIAHPEYFIENNYGGKNKHSELSPKMSSLIILNHVKEGIDLAIQYKLRKIIRDAIEQHHGNDIVTFFYKQALDDSIQKGVNVNEQDYRYSGSPPREKEVVLVSLADACEAASRSMEKPSPSKIEALVWEIFRKRIREHQLDYAELTFRELAIVRKSFVKTITTMLHGRISYPKDEKDEEDSYDLFTAAKSMPGSKHPPTKNNHGKNS